MKFLEEREALEEALKRLPGLEAALEGVDVGMRNVSDDEAQRITLPYGGKPQRQPEGWNLRDDS